MKEILTMTMDTTVKKKKNTCTTNFLSDGHSQVSDWHYVLNSSDVKLFSVISHLTL